MNLKNHNTFKYFFSLTLSTLAFSSVQVSAQTFDPVKAAQKAIDQSQGYHYSEQNSEPQTAEPTTMQGFETYKPHNTELKTIPNAYNIDHITAVPESNVRVADESSADLCGGIEKAIFECLTPSNNKILVCQADDNFQYHYIRSGKKNTFINSNFANLKKYPWDGRTEAIGFLSQGKEYKVFAKYSERVDANNIYDDNIAGGVQVFKNGNKISFANCAKSPKSIDFFNIFERNTQQ